MSLLSHLHPLDFFLALLFLAINIIVGAWYRGRSQNFTEYAVGDKNFSTSVLTATIVATCLSGSIFFIVLENTHAEGLYYVITIMGLPLSLLITGSIIGPRMGKFLSNVSIPHILGDHYGSTVQIVAGISATLHAIGYIAGQFKAIARITEALLGYAGAEVTIITAILVILYATSGGVRAVTFTDVVQFFTFGTLLPVLALSVWNHMGQVASAKVVAVFQNDARFSLGQVVQWTPAFRATLVLLGYYAIPFLTTGRFQRMVMAKNIKQIRQSFLWATMLCFAILLCIIWLSILLLADQPDLKSNQLATHMIKTYTYPGLKGLLGIGIIALAMSTADSFLNSCAVVITNDIVPHLPFHYRPSIRIAKISTLGIGFLALLLALRMENILKTIIIFGGFPAAIVVVPIMLTFFGFKTSRRVVLMAMGAGFVAMISSLLYSGNEKSFFIGQITNLVILLGAHYGLREEGGWGYNPLPKKDSFQSF